MNNKKSEKNSRHWASENAEDNEQQRHEVENKSLLSGTETITSEFRMLTDPESTEEQQEVIESICIIWEEGNDSTSLFDL